MERSPLLERMDARRKYIYPVFLVTEVVGIVSVVLMVVWCLKYLGGFAWDSSSQQFNWHPLLMMVGLLLLYGNSIAIYRVLDMVSHSSLLRSL